MQINVGLILQSNPSQILKVAKKQKQTGGDQTVIKNRVATHTGKTGKYLNILENKISA